MKDILFLMETYVPKCPTLEGYYNTKEVWENELNSLYIESF